METRLSLAPGQNGTKKLLATYGERLVCLRYRYDAARQLRHKTVELIFDNTPWRPQHKLWEVDWKTVCTFALQDRVVDEPREAPMHP